MISFLKSKEKKQVIETLNEQFGVEELPYLLIETGNEKIRAFSGSLSKDEIVELNRHVRIELIGQYFIKKESSYLRLSLDATQLLNTQLTKNVLQLTEEQLRDWIRGLDLPIQAPHGPIILKYHEDAVGCGYSKGNTILNYIPKERRLKK
ncbi:MAG TPA: hypothetical protein VJK51_01700 [Candidatus Nanoarchaeia archaeon]|nr:hypothetical protein [Candidatus Nanoarchaeia archaeon]